MGIDPVTHEPLNKQEAASSSPAQHLPQPAGNNNHLVVMKETDDRVPNSEENSSSSPAAEAENSSSGEESSSLLLDNICSDDSLMNSLWLDETPLVEALWDTNNNNTTPPIIAAETENNTKVDMGFVVPSNWEDTCAWLLDCQDFGIHDFEFNCFNEIESNALQAIGMKEEKH